MKRLSDEAVKKLRQHLTPDKGKTRKGERERVPHNDRFELSSNDVTITSYMNDDPQICVTSEKSIKPQPNIGARIILIILFVSIVTRNYCAHNFVITHDIMPTTEHTYNSTLLKIIKGTRVRNGLPNMLQFMYVVCMVGDCLRYIKCHG